MRVSIFTPTHDPRHLADAYRSLLAQSYTDWEWIVVANGTALSGEHAGVLDVLDDERVQVIDATREQCAGVGGWKRLAVSHCTGEILLELDHDDMLAPACVAELVLRFEANPSAALVYANTVQIEEDGKPNHERYRQGIGWCYREVPGEAILAPDTDAALLDSQYSEICAFPPTPHNVSLIWFAPNHPRAFTRAAYDEAGGYDADLVVCDDQDLMGRLYRVGEFVQIDAPLYLQRVHAGQTQLDAKLNAEIQVLTLDMYERDLAGAAVAWATREGLTAFDVGCGNAKADGFLGIDLLDGSDVDLIGALPDLSFLPDSSVGVLRLVDVLEHVADKMAAMAELHRVLAPGGLLLSLTPSTDGRGAFQDPTHVSFWNENSFWYWTDDAYRVYSPQTADVPAFQVSRLRTSFPSTWHAEHHISYVQANLVAIKDSHQPRNGGELLVEAGG